MSKSARTLIAILCVICLVLGGLLIWSRIDANKSGNTEPVLTKPDTSEYKLYKNIISQDEVEHTLFGQPISPERNGEYRIGIKTAIDGDYHATLTIYLAQDGKYVEVFSCEALVGKNGPGKQSEGDVKTPLGTWTIGEAYGIKEDPGSKVPFTQITDDMYWCATGSNGLNYNTLLYKSEHPDWDYSEDEHLMDYPIRYAYLLDLGYNAAGAPYAGNAIFLHCWKEPDYPTVTVNTVEGDMGIKRAQDDYQKMMNNTLPKNKRK